MMAARSEEQPIFRSVLIANRGEIAVRIMQTCHELGIECIAVYSDADAGAYHVRVSDRAYRIGAAAARASYLDGQAIIEVAVAAGADAVHPGYGFLAENAEFARAVCAAGIVWIGPSPEVIALLGHKPSARGAAQRAGVPVVPGYDGSDQSISRFREEAERIGYPIMLKAASGGGGKGMRVVSESGELEEQLAAAQREATAAFDDGRIFLEKLLLRPRHVEVQVLADTFGNVIHLGERDCSAQRRHQKVLEEAPSPAVGSDLRAALGASAVQMARSSGYTNAGTVEYLVSGGDFYFLEVNTRIQVEHPVTEAVYGVDLVRLQLVIASGRPLPLKQDDLVASGHAVEARIYAEDPDTGFLPSAGIVSSLSVPTGPGIRVDAGVQSGDEVTVNYDPMIAKLTVHAESRELALARLGNALQYFQVDGPATNLAFLQWLVAQPLLLRGDVDVNFIDRDWDAPALAPVPPEAIVAAALWQAGRTSQDTDPWRSLNGWRSSGTARTYRYAVGAGLVEVRLTASGPCRWHVDVDGHRAATEVTRLASDSIVFGMDSVWHTAEVELERSAFRVHHRGKSYTFRLMNVVNSDTVRESGTGGDALIKSPMPGTVLRVLVQEGQNVGEREPLAILEAMKMEHVIEAPGTGRVLRIHAQQGDVVSAGATLIQLAPIE